MNEQESTSKVRTRIAPSPTGYPHIGTIYQALFNFAYAKKHGGKFIVRIEDTDRSRFVEGAEEVIFSALDWFGLTEDESPRKDNGSGPYRQSERLNTYHIYAQELLDKDRAYMAFYRKEDAGKKKDYSHKDTLEINVSDTVPEVKPPATVGEMLKTQDWVVKLKVPKNTKIKVYDEIRGEIDFDSDQVTEQVLLKSDGFPTYHLAVVVDDHLMNISHIVRAEEWLSSLPKHKLLYEYFDWKMPPIYHTATLRNPDKSKLSKRHGHTNVKWFKDEGYLPEAILNYLALLGWSHPDEKEIFDIDEFIRLFDLKDISPVAPIFDLTKLTWMNGEYIRMMQNPDLVSKLIDFYKNDEIITHLLTKNAFISDIIGLTKTRMKTLKDFKDLVMSLIEAPDKSKLSEEHISIAPRIREALDTLPEEGWKSDRIFEVMKSILEERSVKMPVFYVLFTGNKQGLPLPHLLEILQKKETLERLDQIVK